MGSPWKAIADDSRRQVLVLLNDGERTPSEMAGSFDFTLRALSTHLRVLRESGVVFERRDGKNRLYSVNRRRYPISWASSTTSGTISWMAQGARRGKVEEEGGLMKGG